MFSKAVVPLKSAAYEPVKNRAALMIPRGGRKNTPTTNKKFWTSLSVVSIDSNFSIFLELFPAH
jgi:hypothetical protein